MVTVEDQIDEGTLVDLPTYMWSEANRGCLRPCDVIERNEGAKDEYLVLCWDMAPAHLIAQQASVLILPHHGSTIMHAFCT